MIPFKTPPAQVVQLATIVIEMDKAGLQREFIATASEVARFDQGAFDLMSLWLDAKSDPTEQDEIVADLQECIDDYAEAPHAPLQKPYINFEKLDSIVEQVTAHKKKLRDLIDQNGGVSQVARKSGIPQPSLSRMLRSASMPRRATLYKIANALNLSETEIVAEWTR